MGQPHRVLRVNASEHADMNKYQASLLIFAAVINHICPVRHPSNAIGSMDGDLDFDCLRGFINLLSELPDIWELAHCVLGELMQNRFLAVALPNCHID